MSPTPDSTFAELQQTIDDLRRQLAERTAERDQALAREAATGEVLAVINSSPGDLAPVFDAILEKAHTLCGVTHGGLVIYDGEHFRLVAERGMPAPFAELVRQPFPARGARRRLVDGAAFVHVADVAAREPADLDDPIPRASDDAGFRTLLMVPLRQDNKLLGYVTAHRKEVQPFSDKQIALLQNFAAQAVIAMENARLITETREALEQQTATAEVLGVINSSPGNLAPVFDAILGKAMSLCGIAFGALQLYEEGKFRAVAVRGVARTLAELLREPIAPIRGAPPARLLSGEPFVHILDMAEVAEQLPDDPRARANVADGLRTVLFVPLRKEADLVGYIAGYRKKVRPFTPKQIALLQNFAAQAVIAMENARLITETREALEQQTATAEVLGVINSSPGDLTPVFDAMLERAMRLIGAAFGIANTYDGQQFRTAALHRVPPALAELWLSTPPEPGPNSALTRLASGDDVVHIEDYSTYRAYKADEPRAKALVDVGGVRTYLAVPLRKDGALIGTIAAYRQEVRPFTNKQIAVLQNFASQAVIAMENARLITETREALEQQTATAEVLQIINSSPGDLAPVFDAMLEKAMRLCEADFGALCLFGGEDFRVTATRGFPPALNDFLQGELPVHPGGIPDRLQRGERVIHIPDLTAMQGAARTPVFDAMIDQGGARSTVWVDLRKDDRAVGYFAIYRQEVRPFTDKQIALLENFAAQAVIAMENARLITETREALEHQTATADVLGVINSSPGDLQPVFDSILEKAHSLCGVTFGFLQLYDSGKLRAVALRGVPEAVVEPARQGFSPSLNHPIRGLLDGVPYVHIRDLAEIDDPAARRVAQLGGIRTSLFVALRKDGTLLGMISAGRKEIRPFTDKQIALLQNFAAQAVIAMENARLLGELRQRTEEVAELNRGLEARVAEQVEELGRVGRLKRFLAPQLAELIVSQGDEKILESHRREIVVVFCDLRGYTAFTETAEPEEVLDFLREYHGALGPLVSQFEGTLDQFSGDGIMVFFNDPLPIPNPAERAVNMAVAMREAAGSLIAAWRERGRDLGFGSGIAQGYATLGQIGFSERSGYTAIGTVCNVAARLCAEAKDGQILLSQRVNVALKGSVVTEQMGALALKGLTQPVIAFNVPLAASQPALRVIEGGPQNV